jgi:anti-sigma factor RsiW
MQPSDEDLIAHLDGELTGRAADDLEDLLARDPELRRRADALKRSYDLLDYLPRPVPSPTFASRTMTHLQAAASGSRSQPSVPAGPVPQPSPVRRLAGWLVASVVAVVFGYSAHLLVKPHLDRNAAKGTGEQVRLLERLPLYLGVDDFAFVRSLDKADLFPPAESDGEAPHNGPPDALSSAELTALDRLFQSYPPVRQQQLRRLDEELIAAADQKHLLEVLERYAIWLDRLPNDYRTEVLSAPAAAERLEVVLRVRARVWRERLPAVVRDRLASAEDAQREQILAEAKARDAERVQLWEQARRDWASIRENHKPWPFDTAEVAKRLPEHIDKTLRQRLLPTELRELELVRKEAEANPGWWNDYVYGFTIYRLSEARPYLPEPANGKLIRLTSDLPMELIKRLTRDGTGRKQLTLLPSHSKWPDFAEVIAKEVRDLPADPRFRLPASFFGPTRPDEYTQTVRSFLERDLAPKLDAKERDGLKKLEGSPWPDHSRHLMDLARKHDLSVPGVSLPGTPSRWDKTYRRRR